MTFVPFDILLLIPCLLSHCRTQITPVNKSKKATKCDDKVFSAVTSIPSYYS